MPRLPVALILGMLPVVLALPGRVSSLHAAPGDPLGEEFQVNTYTTSGEYRPAVASDGSGGFVVVWESRGSGGTDTSSTSIQGQRYDAFGIPAGGQFQVNAFTRGLQNEPVIAPDGSGGFVVVWESYLSAGMDTSGYSVQGRRFDVAGVPVGGDFEVNTYTTLYQRRPAVASDGSGGFVVVWQSTGSSGTDTDGVSIQVRRYDAAGIPAGGELQVNTYTTSYQIRPAVAPDGVGGFVVVWESGGSDGTDTSDRSIQGRRYDAADGTPIGGQFQVNTYTTSYQRFPAVAADGSGGFVVVWESYGSSGTDTSGSSIQAQRYDAAGIPVGGEFQVNTHTTSCQSSPAVAPDEAGGFVVVWRSCGVGGPDGPGDSIQGQRYDAAGTPVGGEFQVNTYTTAFRGYPSASPDGSGGFVVVWESYGGSGTDTLTMSIQGQRFEGVGGPATIDNPIKGKKLVVVDRTAAASPSAKLVSSFKRDPGIQKGAPMGGAAAVPPGLTGVLQVRYTGCGPGAVKSTDACNDTVATAARYVLPADWRVNRGAVAKYTNRDAPDGAGNVKVAVIKPGKRAKVVAKGLGDGPALDLVAAGRPDPSGVLVLLAVSNAIDGRIYRMCTRYQQAAVKFEAVASGDGRKLVARGGVPVPCP